MTQHNADSRRHNESEPLNDNVMRSDQQDSSDDLNEPVAMSALSEKRATASSHMVNSSNEISSFTGSQISTLSICSLQKKIDEQGFQLTDKNFIQHQVRLLSTPFTIQDCPELLCSQGRVTY